MSRLKVMVSDVLFFLKHVWIGFFHVVGFASATVAIIATGMFIGEASFSGAKSGYWVMLFLGISYGIWWWFKSADKRLKKDKWV